jgi:hypothetical protein
MSDAEPPETPEAPAEKPAKAKKGKADAKGKGKDKKSKDKKGAASSGGLSVASHPRASASVRQIKGWGGLLAFGITAYLSFSHGASPDVAGMRALVAGATGYVVSYGCAVVVWRQLMIAEVRAKIEASRPSPAPAEAPTAGAEQPAG